MKSMNFIKMKKMVMMFAVALIGTLVFSVSASADVTNEWIDDIIVVTDQVGLKGNGGYYLASTTLYDWDGSKWSKRSEYKYTYDKHKNVKSVKSIFSASHRFITRYQYTYDKTGKIIESKEYDSDCKYIYTYNKKGCLTKLTNYRFLDGDKTFEGQVKYKYDKKGNLIKKERIDRNKKTAFSNDYSYTYKKGVIASRKTVVRYYLGGYSKWNEQTSYYQSGYRKGRIKKITSNHSPNKYTYTYTYKPDKTGKNVGTCIAKDNGGLSSKTVYTWKKIK